MENGSRSSTLRDEILYDWSSLIDKMNDLIEDTRARGGTDAYKTGSYRDALAKLLKKFMVDHHIYQQYKKDKIC